MHEIVDSASFGEATRAHLEVVEKENREVLDSVSELLHEVISRDGLIFAAGSGHSSAMVLETFYRAGGLACVYPIYHPALLPLEGGKTSTLIERTENFAESLLAKSDPGQKDVALIFSNSGVNSFPVELARKFNENGTPVVAFVSVPHMENASPRSDRKLGEVADYVVNTAVPYGDAVYRAGESRTAALSSLVSVFCWDLALASLADKAHRSGLSLPLWRSANADGGDEHNAELLSRYRTRIPQL